MNVEIKKEIACEVDKHMARCRMELKPSTERILFRADMQKLTDRYLFGLVTKMDAMLN